MSPFNTSATIKVLFIHFDEEICIQNLSTIYLARDMVVYLHFV